MTTKLVWDNKSMSGKLSIAPKKFDVLLDALVDYHSVQVQDKSRANAPWTDQTSNARNGLLARGFSSEEGKGIILGHSVEYGVYLETMQSGRFRVIMPTLEAQLPVIMKQATGLLRKL